MLIVVLVYLLCNVPLAISPMLPHDDTFAVFQYLSFIYQDYFYSGTIPQWLPYFQFGTPLDVLNIIFLSPISLFVVVAGKLLGVVNTWHLFLAMLFIESAILFVGLLLLLRELQLRKDAIVVALAVHLLTCVLTTNIWTHVRTIYLIPLALYWIIRAFSTKRLHLFLLGGLLLLINSIGCAPYWIPVFLLLFCMVTVILAVNHRAQFSWKVEFNVRNLLSISLCILFCACYGYFLANSRDHLYFNAPYRDPETLKVSLDVFLNYGGDGMANFFELFLGIPVGDVKWVDFFLTMPGLFFMIYGFVRARSANAVLFKILFVFFLLMSLGKHTPLASAIYYLPLASLFRHLVALYCFAKLFAIVIIAYGYQQFVEDDLQARKKFVVGILAFMLLASLATAYYFRLIIAENPPYHILLYLTFSGILALGPILWRQSAGMTPLILLIVGCQAIFYYNLYTYKFMEIDTYKTERPTVHIIDELTQVRPLRFEERRLPNNLASSYGNSNWSNALLSDRVYELLVMTLEAPRALANLDLCSPFRVDRVNFAMSNVKRLTDLMQYNAEQYGQPKMLNSIFENMIGCNDYSKIKLIEGYSMVGTASSSMSDGGVYLEGKGVVIVRDKDEQTRESTQSLQERGIKVTGFSNNHISMQVAVDSPAAWLYYADAYHPDWRAYIDNVRAEIVEANYAFKALQLPQGNHVVEFRFDSRLIFKLFCLINIIGFLTVFVAMIAGCFLARQRDGLCQTIVADCGEPL